MNNTMLHMKLNSAVSVFAVAAAFAVLLPSNFVRAKALPIMLPANVRNIMPKSDNVTVMIIISNAMLKHGANKTVITQPLVLFLNTSPNNALTEKTFTNHAKQIMTELVKNSDIQRPVLPDKNLRRTPDAVLMIPLTVPAVPRPVVRVILL